MTEETCLDQKPYARLIHSQLILALTILRPGGTLLFKLTHCDRYSTMHTIQQLESISDNLTCFKPKSCWSHSASFYVVAKGVQTDSPECGMLLEEWARHLHGLMTGTEDAEEDCEEVGRLSEDMIDSGEVKRMVPMFRQVWKTQADSLEKMLRPRSGFGRF